MTREVRLGRVEPRRELSQRKVVATAVAVVAVVAVAPWALVLVLVW